MIPWISREVVERAITSCDDANPEYSDLARFTLSLMDALEHSDPSPNRDFNANTIIFIRRNLDSLVEFVPEVKDLVDSAEYAARVCSDHASGRHDVLDSGTILGNAIRPFRS